MFSKGFSLCFTYLVLGREIGRERWTVSIRRNTLAVAETASIFIPNLGSVATSEFGNGNLTIVHS